MSILVNGRSGQLARALGRMGHRCCGQDELDLRDLAALPEKLAALAPTAIINAAAYTAVDQAEAEEDLATLINGQAPGVIAAYCARAEIPLIHVSTDYVFDGAGNLPHTPDRPTAPLGAYGRSKLAGETAISAAGGTFAILRTAAVFSADGSNFVKTMVKLGATRDALNIVDDQITGPTPAAALADACVTVATQLRDDVSKSGIYHFSGAPEVSWAAFAEAIFAAADQTVSVTKIPSSDYPTAAVRPLNSRLDCASFTSTFGVPRPDWRPALTDVVTQLTKETTA